MNVKMGIMMSAATVAVIFISLAFVGVVLYGTYEMSKE